MKLLFRSPLLPQLHVDAQNAANTLSTDDGRVVSELANGERNFFEEQMLTTQPPRSISTKVVDSLDLTAQSLGCSVDNEVRFYRMITLISAIKAHFSIDRTAPAPVYPLVYQTGACNPSICPSREPELSNVFCPFKRHGEHRIYP
ncbi:hypothetical protein ANCDUO_23268 [Ancylostoma duodenale]|uniref:Uncharacterized protein n=1 Tax=Ancylostoma duodenale TaxID=51022 RepID=A0A0C2FP97_9BILA|nr:hypothetical protein ANCDUO_23268 [Ancylostoma duodenale]